MVSNVLRRIRLPLAVVLAAAFATPAHAQDDREEREERRVMKADEFSQEQLSEEYRRLARQKRQEEIAFAKDLLSRGTLRGETKAEMMLRLADLYFEEGRDIYLTEMLEYERIFDACFNDEACNSEGIKPNNEESRKWQGRSIKLYEQILQNYPTFGRADEATFYMASALKDTGDSAGAVKEFTRLVKTYPESGYVPDAYVMIGEHYFDDNNAYKALLAYQKAAAYSDSPKYPFAMYKLAWCYYNVGEYGKSIDTMKAVVAYSQAVAAGEQQSTSNIQLQDEALKDLVRFFADAGEMDEAYAYFNKLGKKDLIRSMLKRLATTYFEQGKFEQCIQTYRRLISENPQAPEAPEYQHEIIQAYNKIGRKQETMQEIDRLLKTYGGSSAWARANSSDQDALDEASEYIEKNLRKVAQDYHEEARKLGSGSRAEENYLLAYKAYKVYLNEFPDGKNSYELRYNFAELLYDIKKFDEAYEQYMGVVAMDNNGKHSKFCAEAAIFSTNEMIKKQGASATAAPGGSTEPIALNDWEQKKLTALDQYAKLFPDDEKTAGIIYESAYLLYNRNQFKEASDRFRVVIGMNPGSKKAEQAANLILDSFNLVEDWKNLKDVSKAFYDQEGLGSAAFKKEVYGVYERASFKLIEIDYVKPEKFQEAADAFIAFVGEFPESEVGDLALNNAAVYYYNLGKIESAMSTRHQLIEKYPKSDHYNNQVASLGYDYETIANYEEAARWYEKIFSLDKEHESAADAIYSAALFREALGEWEASIRNYEQYLTAYPDRENLEEVKLQIGGIYEREGKWSNAANVYKTYYDRKDLDGLDPDTLMFARLHYGQALIQQGQASKALSHYEDSIAWYKSAAEGGVQFSLGVEFVAEMMFKVADSEYQEYAAMRISGPNGKVSRSQEDKVLKDQLTAKAKKLLEMERIYGEIIQTGAGEWGLAALVQLGQAYENMGDSLQNAHVPSYLSDDQVEFYKMALEDQVYPQTEKAVAAYSSALEKSYELNLYNENTSFATRQLGALRPDDYPPFYETVNEAGFTSSSTVTTTYETSL